MSSVKRNQQVFGRRNEPHTIIIAHGDHIRHFTVKPWMMAVMGTVSVMFAVGYVFATSYLVFRDDLIGASIARQARMQHAYEDRISALRSQVDRIISRQLLDQQLMEQKVAELVERQTALFDRQSRLGPLLERADDAAALPVPSARPEKQAKAGMMDFTTTASIEAPARGGTGYKAADEADLTFSQISGSLKQIEADQIEKLQAVIAGARQTGDKVVETLADAGIAIKLDDDTATGGPFIPAGAGEHAAFDRTVEELDAALSRLDLIKSQVDQFPLKNPAPGNSVSSTFGNRKDPILGSQAFHGGIDFRAPTGEPVLATGDGTVVSAGWNGGYGQMVEIKHANGWITRYAHMSRLSVSEGDKISAGQKVGEVGSTGRSTGPHLHYEIRRQDAARDPAPFLKTGKRIAGLL